MIRTGVKEARQHFTEYLAKVLQGEEIVITKREQPVARILPVKKAVRKPLESHKELRKSLSKKGNALSATVIESRRAERF